MSNIDKINQQESFSLKTFFEKLSADDQNTLEVGIFNQDTPIEVLEKITDQEDSREVMGRLRRYLEMKAGGATTEVLKADAKEIEELIDKKLE